MTTIHKCIPVLRTTEVACTDMAVEDFQDWVHHARWPARTLFAMLIRCCCQTETFSFLLFVLYEEHFTNPTVFAEMCKQYFRIKKAFYSCICVFYV